jgi:hypothetical protein
MNFARRGVGAWSNLKPAWSNLKPASWNLSDPRTFINYIDPFSNLIATKPLRYNARYRRNIRTTDSVGPFISAITQANNTNNNWHIRRRNNKRISEDWHIRSMNNHINPNT